jgi:hypothetical protein
MNLSIDYLGGWVLSIIGILFPILVLKSPHITVYSYGYMLSIIDSNCVVACNCDMLRFSSDVVGGI